MGEFEFTTKTPYKHTDNNGDGDDDDGDLVPLYHQHRGVPLIISPSLHDQSDDERMVN